MLAISVKDDTLDGVSGKRFTFKCGFCEYQHATQVITKPKPILAIVREEYQRENDHHRLFQAAKDMYANKLNYEVLQEQLVRDLGAGKKFKGASLDVIQKLKKMNLSVPLDDNFSEIDRIKMELESNQPESLDEEGDEKESVFGDPGQVSGLTMFKPSLNSNLPSTDQQYPIPKLLTSRYSLKCCDCNHDLLVPTDELLSTKFLTKWNANDHLPLVTISPLINQKFPQVFESGLNTFLINIVNPLPFLVGLNVSVPSEVEINGTRIQSTIPQSNIRIGGYNSKDHPIRGIPTPYLTNETRVSRAELVMRLGKLNTARNNDTSIDMLESLIEKSDNWYLLPIEIIVESPPVTSLKVPIFVTLQSKLPDAMRKLELSKRELSFGYWTVVTLASVEPRV